MISFFNLKVISFVLGSCGPGKAGKERMEVVKNVEALVNFLEPQACLREKKLS